MTNRWKFGLLKQDNNQTEQKNHFLNLSLPIRNIRVFLPAFLSNNIYYHKNFFSNKESGTLRISRIWATPETINYHRCLYHNLHDVKDYFGNRHWNRIKSIKERRVEALFVKGTPLKTLLQIETWSSFTIFHHLKILHQMIWL